MSEKERTITTSCDRRGFLKVTGAALAGISATGACGSALASEPGTEAPSTNVTSENGFEVIEFGNYPQSADGEIAPVEWYVLETRDDGSRLLLSRYCLDCKRYNPDGVQLTWETTPLRAWLNGEFLSEAFTDGEAAQIADTQVTAEDNPTYGTTGGNDTVDKVFLLSASEVEKYFSGVSARIAFPTEYAKANGAWVWGATQSSRWWLRSPAADLYSPASVGVAGNIYDSGLYPYVFYYNNVVRPALVLNA